MIICCYPGTSGEFTTEFAINLYASRFDRICEDNDLNCKNFYIDRLEDNYIDFANFVINTENQNRNNVYFINYDKEVINYIKYKNIPILCIIPRAKDVMTYMNRYNAISQAFELEMRKRFFKDIENISADSMISVYTLKSNSTILSEYENILSAAKTLYEFM